MPKSLVLSFCYQIELYLPWNALFIRDSRKFLLFKLFFVKLLCGVMYWFWWWKSRSFVQIVPVAWIFRWLYCHFVVSRITCHFTSKSLMQLYPFYFFKHEWYCIWYNFSNSSNINLVAFFTFWLLLAFPK